jgi:hypothetical protein
MKPAYIIQKPSWWRSRKEVRDAQGGLAGYLDVVSYWSNRWEGEARGKRVKFESGRWDYRYSKMRDASGEELAHIEPLGWWGMRYKLVYDGEEYTWKPDGWGSGFTILHGTREVLRYSPHMFRPDEVTSNEPDEKKAVLLLIFGLYQLQLYATAAASGGAVSTG